MDGAQKISRSHATQPGVHVAAAQKKNFLCMLEGPHVGWPHLPGASRRWLVRPLATPVVHTCGWAVNVLLAHWSGPRGGDARAPVGRLLVKIIAAAAAAAAFA
jgi:hypothetical protein